MLPLKTLPSPEQPVLYIFHSEDAPVDYIKQINYPEINFVLYKSRPHNRLYRKVDELISRYTGFSVFHHFNYFNKVDVLYPYFEFMDKRFEKINHKVHWLVDFNNRAYPEYYADGGQQMTDFQQDLTSRKEHIVLSSNSLFDELKHYYPAYQNQVSILRFACTLPDVSTIDIEQLKRKYNLNKPYLMSPNQFWEHKNQIVLIEALNVLQAERKLDFQVVFTGSMDVNRGKGHMLSKLLELVDTYQLNDVVRFLGIVERDDQLALMEHAEALIQPSLYEGWSTLVEEAKALNQKIILSDLPVHREQNCANSYYFDPFSAQQLADHIKQVTDSQRNVTQIDYSKNIAEFGKDVLSMLKNELKTA